MPGSSISEELGIDAGAAIDKRHDVGVKRGLRSRPNPGLAEVGVSASRRRGAVRTEAYARHRAASHLLPATSLFSVIGDVPSQRAGGVVTWRAAPRLDLIADLAVRRIDDDFGEELVARARLRLDERGTSLLMRRAPAHRRRRLRVDRGARRRADRAAPRVRGQHRARARGPRRGSRAGRGVAVGAVAGSWAHGDWQAAIALEASASAEYRYRVDGLVQLARRWSLR